MQDFKLEQDNYGLFDMIVNEETQDFEGVNGFETAIDVQLFIDQRGTKQEIATARNRQGWMADIATKPQGYQVGSFLYLKNQARNTQNDKNDIAAYSKNAIDYFVAIGAAKEVTASVNGLNIEGSIIASNDNVTRYSKLWRATNAD